MLNAPAFTYNLVSISMVRGKGFRITTGGADDGVDAKRLEINHKTTASTKLLAARTCEGLYEGLIKTVYHNHAPLAHDTNEKL